MNIGEMLNQVVILFQDEFNRCSIQSSVKISERNLTIAADEKQITQVLINMLRNAVDAVANNKEKKIVLSAFRSDEKTVISVCDNGCGIAVEDLEDIFIPFYTTKDGGSGIGLSISRQIMRMHNGQIRVKSLPGETTFSLLFQA